MFEMCNFLPFTSSLSVVSFEQQYEGFHVENKCLLERGILTLICSLAEDAKSDSLCVTVHLLSGLIFPTNCSLIHGLPLPLLPVRSWQRCDVWHFSAAQVKRRFFSPLKAFTHFDESLLAVHSWRGQKPDAVYQARATPAFRDEYISSYKP